MLIKDRVLPEIKSKRYNIKIAETDSEVEAALNLRYRVFKEELERDFDFKENKDKDLYDDQSHHLIVINNEKNEIVGTYRLQMLEQARMGNGFVSEERFRIDQFPDEVLKNAVEVGRACISKEHRSGRVLFFLWKGFAGYLNHFSKRYLFGYAALNTINPAVAINTYHHLKKEGFLHPGYQIEPKKECMINFDETKINTDEIEIPPLLQNYLDVGSKICGKPSFDSEVKLIHFLILLDKEKISERTRKLFFG